MPEAMPVADADVMRRCWELIEAMFVDQGLHADMRRHWWRTPHGRFDWRSPMDALLDGEPAEVYRVAEDHCDIMRPLQKASHER